MPGFNICGAGDGPSSTLDSVRKHRWRVSIADPIKDFIIYAYKCTRPIPEFDVMTMHRGQDEIYFPGKNKWSPVDITFYETIDENKLVTESLNKWKHEVVLDLANSRLNHKFKKPVIIDLLGNCDQVIYRYGLSGAWPLKIVPDDLNYESSDLSSVTVTLKFDKCQEKASDAGV